MKNIKLFLEDISGSAKRKEYIETLDKQKREKKDLKLRHQKELENAIRKDFRDKEAKRLKRERESANNVAYTKKS